VRYLKGLCAVAVSALVASGAAAAKPPKPVITGFFPTRGQVGTTVTIVGSHFVHATVFFNGTMADATVNRAGTRIRVTVPEPDDVDEDVGGPIQVMTHGGAAQTKRSFEVVQASSPQYAFPKPRISGLTPTHAKPGASVAISGSGFGGASAVTFGGVTATYTVPSETKIVAVVPARARSGTITVTTPGGTASSASGFSVG
jgi:hypothetical protein